jgi:hypothetical protein
MSKEGNAGFSYQLLMVAALSVLFMPFLGPIVDHHFAERQYNHGHIFLRSVDVEHIHFYEADHAHDHIHDIPATHDSNGPESNELPDEVVFLASQDGIGPSFAPPVTIAVCLDLVFPDLGDNHFLTSLASQDNPPPETSISPPKKPPRV